MASEQDRSTQEVKLDEIHARLATAVEQLVSGDDWRQAMGFAARFRSRSFRNTLLIWAQHRGTFESGLVTRRMSPGTGSGSRLAVRCRRDSRAT